MSDGTHIEWADASWNPVVGCTRVSEGCRNCYAEAMAHRFRTAPMSSAPNDPRAHPLNLLTDDSGRWNGTVRLLPDRLSEPLRWRKPRRIFVCSMSDLFHQMVPHEYVDRVLAVAALCPQHTFLILTKRPGRMADYLADEACAGNVNVAACRAALHWDIVPESVPFQRNAPVQRWPLQNVWLGTSVEDQKAANERLPHLLRCPAAVRWLSVEPLLAPVDLREIPTGRAGASDGCAMRDMLHWIVVGGESGHHARPCSINWINSVESQCHAGGVPLFVKQLGARPGFTSNPGGEEFVAMRLRDRKGGDMEEWPAHLRVREWPEVRRG